MQIVGKPLLQSRCLKYLGLLLFSLCCLLPAQGAVDAALYQGEAPVASYSAVDWQKALAPALQQVLVKLSGNQNVAQVEGVRKALNKAAALVVSYNYAGGSDAKPLALQVRFSPKAIDALLKTAGQPNLATSGSDSKIDASAASAPAALPASADLPAVNMVVSGVAGLQDYAALLDYLRHLDGVIDVSSQQTRGDRVLLVIKLNKPVAGLVQVIDSEQKLIKQSLPAAANTAPTLLSYRWTNTNLPAAAAPATTSGIAPSVAASLQPSPTTLPKTSLQAAPVVEGVPAATSSGVPAVSNPSPAQSFAAPPADHGFETDDGVAP